MHHGCKHGKNWIKDNKKLNFNLLVPKDDYEKIKVAEKIKQDLSEIQIGITIKEVSWDKFKAALEKGDFDLALTSIDIKNEFQIQEMVSMGSKYNYARYMTNEMTNILEKLQNSAEDSYDENMEEFKRIYKNDMPYIGLYFKTNALLTNKSVKGEFLSTDYNPYKNIYNFCK